MFGISLSGTNECQNGLACPNARFFVIGMGAKDIGFAPDTEVVSNKTIGNLGQMVQLVRDRGKQPILFNLPDENEDTWPSRLAFLARRFNAKRDYHNARLKEFCDEQGISLADICSRLNAEHFGDKLRPKAKGAKIIAEEVFKVLAPLHKSA